MSYSLSVASIWKYTRRAIQMNWYFSMTTSTVHWPMWKWLKSGKPMPSTPFVVQPCNSVMTMQQSDICILDFHCARSICACTISKNIVDNIDYCRYQCPIRVCTCAPLMFQCSVGRCIPYSHVCDNIYDCADSSDEFCVVDFVEEYHSQSTAVDVRFLTKKPSWWCLGFICSSGLCIDGNFVNDLIPDGSDAEDEFHSLSIKYHGLQFHCDDTQAIPCVSGHSKCFKINHLCIYDHDNLGHISYCRDGAHLLSCRNIKCVNTFKCPQSYCIPIRKVCDGINDCYEDESNCHNNVCPGHLKCRDVEYCIHPSEVCDD